MLARTESRSQPSFTLFKCDQEPEGSPRQTEFVLASGRVVTPIPAVGPTRQSTQKCQNQDHDQDGSEHMRLLFPVCTQGLFMADAPARMVTGLGLASLSRIAHLGRRHADGQTAELEPPSEAAKMSPIEQIWTVASCIVGSGKAGIEIRSLCKLSPRNLPWRRIRALRMLRPSTA